MHTIGPYWMAADHNPPDGTDQEVWDVGVGDRCLATFDHRDNALLFRAGPEMLAALRMVEEMRESIAHEVYGVGPILDAVSAAIARAKGET